MRKLAIATGIAAGTAMSAALLIFGGSSTTSATPALEGGPLPGVALPVPDLPVPVPEVPLPGLPTGA